MELNRTKNASRNFISNGAWRIFALVMRFVMRTVMIYTLGADYLGLTNLFSSILQVLNMAELGVGSAMIYSMYKPVAENDHDTICALMNLYRKYYRIIGLVILTVGLLLTPFLPYLINGDLPGGLNLYILYFINLSSTVSSYWFFAYKNSILVAYQRSDISSKVNICVDIVKFTLQTLSLVTFKNYYLYVIILVIAQIVSNCIVAYFSQKLFPQYHPIGQLEKNEVNKINNRIFDLFISKIGATIVSSSDSIIISAFLGLTILGIYQNYFFIVSAVITILSSFYTASTAGVGNSLITETKEKNFKDLNKITFFSIWVSCFAVSCLYNLMQPFITLWVGSSYLLSQNIVLCLCIYFVIQELYAVFCLFKDAGGIWHKDRFRPFVTALANLTMNIIMVQFWGLYGVVLSTVISMLIIGVPWLIHNLFTTIFDWETLGIYLKKLFIFMVVFLIGWVMTTFICQLVNHSALLTLMIRMVLCILIPNLIFIIIFHRSEEYQYWVKLVKRIFKNKLKKFS